MKTKNLGNAFAEMLLDAKVKIRCDARRALRLMNRNGIEWTYENRHWLVEEIISGSDSCPIPFAASILEFLLLGMIRRYRCMHYENKSCS